MFTKPFIRSFTAGCMLLIFSFSISPRLFLHSWLASHTDEAVKATGSGQQKICKQVFNCHCDNMVAESPFTHQDNDFKLFAFHPLSNHKETIPAGYYSASNSFFSLRGPPASCS